MKNEIWTGKMSLPYAANASKRYYAQHWMENKRKFNKNREIINKNKNELIKSTTKTDTSSKSHQPAATTIDHYLSIEWIENKFDRNCQKIKCWK